MQRLKIWPTIFTNVYPRGFEPKQSYTVVLLCRCFTSYMEINIFVLFPQGDDLGGDQAVPLGTRLQLRASINTFSGISKEQAVVPLGTRLQLRASINTFSGISRAGCTVVPSQVLLKLQKYLPT